MLKYSTLLPVHTQRSFVSYSIVGIFQGVKFSWIWKILHVGGNIFVVECSLNKPHPL